MNDVTPAPSPQFSPCWLCDVPTECWTAERCGVRDRDDAPPAVDLAEDDPDA
jgi:hypothetical protein